MPASPSMNVIALRHDAVFRNAGSNESRPICLRSVAWTAPFSIASVYSLPVRLSTTVSVSDVDAISGTRVLRTSLMPAREPAGPVPPLHRSSGSRDLDQLLGKGRQQFDALVAYDRQILDPDAARTLQVDPRLDRDDVAGGEDVGRLRGQSRRLVHLEADTVAEAVAELLAEPGLGDRLPREQV